MVNNVERMGNSTFRVPSSMNYPNYRQVWQAWKKIHSATIGTDLTRQDHSTLLKDFKDSIESALKKWVYIHNATEIENFLVYAQNGTWELSRLSGEMENYITKHEIPLGNNTFRRPDRNRYEGTLKLENGKLTLTHREVTFARTDTDIPLRFSLNTHKVRENLRDENLINRAKEELKNDPEFQQAAQTHNQRLEIRKGMTVDEIKKLQAIVGTEVDGIIGRKTRAAVNAYNRALRSH